MLHIQLTTIAGKRLLDPDEERLSQELLMVPWEKWYRSPNESAILEVILSEVEPSAIRSSHDPQHPVLIILQPNVDEYLCSWLQNGDEWVPYNGEPCDAFSVYDSGGDQYRIPDACLVDPDTAVRIAVSFMRTQTRDESVPWTSRFDLPVDVSFWKPM